MPRDAAVSPREWRRHVSLRGRSEFERIYRDGRRRRARDLVVIEAAGRNGPPQVGFVAGKRVGGAVARNRAKRRLREAAALVALEEGRAYIVIAGRGTVEARFADLVAALESAVSRGRRMSEDGRWVDN